MNQLKSSLKDILFPSYDEYTIFMLNFVFVVIYSIDHNCRSEIYGFYTRQSIDVDDNKIFFLALGIGLMFIAGVIVSIFHVFVKKEKDIFVETLMKFTAMLITGVSGIVSGIYILEHGSGWILISPTWNIIMGVVLIYQIGFIESINMDQRDATFAQVALGVVAVSSLLFILHKFYQLYWAISLSVCVNYITNVNHFVAKNGPFYKSRLLITSKLN